MALTSLGILALVNLLRVDMNHEHGDEAGAAASVWNTKKEMNKDKPDAVHTLKVL